MTERTWGRVRTTGVHRSCRLFGALLDPEQHLAFHHEVNGLQGVLVRQPPERCGVEVALEPDHEARSAADCSKVERPAGVGQFRRDRIRSIPSGPRTRTLRRVQVRHDETKVGLGSLRHHADDITDCQC